MNEPDLNSIIAGLTDDDFARLNEVAAQIFGGGAPGADKQPAGRAEEQPAADKGGERQQGSSQPPPPQSPFGNIDPEIMAKIMKILPLLQGGKDDERTRLIMALKPLLSQPRRQRADEALQLMRLLEVLPLLGNSGLF